MPIERRRTAARLFAAFAALSIATAALAREGRAPDLRLAFSGPPEAVFTPSQGCDGDDVPDVNARAFRDDRGNTVVFALHDLNRELRGPDLNHLKVDCAIPFRGHGNANPAAYDDHAWIAAVWTRDGRRVVALAHHEYHANEHPGRCAVSDAMACWYNTILELDSSDGGRSFAKEKKPVVAAAPFRQSVDQTRHRGFFNPSNIVELDGAWYFFASTTGWPGQDYGACLFRSRTPEDASSWRAYDGRSFSVRFGDPYAGSPAAHRPCAAIEPFRVPVGSISRQRSGGDFLAVWQVHEDRALFPAPGFYYATSRDLLHWSGPRLLLAGDTLYDDPCASGGLLINYPSLLDADARTRDFEDIGTRAWLYYAALRVKGCAVTGERILMRRPLTIEQAR